MATIAGGTIGTGGTYPTLAAWWAACPADLVAADQIWQGRLLNQEFVSAATALTISGKTTDATRYIELTAEPGASYLDHASKLTNPLRYDATKGAAIRVTGSAAQGILCQQQYTRISKLQVLATATDVNSSSAIIVSGATGTDCGINQCILESSAALGGGTVKMDGPGNKIRNSVVLQHRVEATAVIAALLNGAQAYNCTLAATQVKVTNGLTTMYAAGVLKNVGIFNVVNARDTGTAPTITNCYTDGAGAGFSTAPYSTATFANITYGTHDFRKVAGSVLIDAGLNDATYAPTDVLGNARPAGASTDVGADEYQAAAVDTTAPVLSAPTATATTSSTATGTVATDEGGGTLYYLATVNATETVATIKASGGTQAVSATGTRNVSLTGLTAGATYYLHFVHTDAAGNDSAVANSAAFTTPSPDTVAPTFAGGSAITPGAITSSSLAFSYPAATDNVAVTGYQTSKDSGASWQDNGTGLSGSFTGLAASTTYQIWVRAYDNGATRNYSTPLQLAMTTSAAPTGSITTDAMTSSGTLRASVACTYTWFLGGVIGTTTGTATHGSGTTAAGGALTAAGLPKGAGYLMVKFADGGICYQAGTVA